MSPVSTDLFAEITRLRRQVEEERLHRQRLEGELLAAAHAAGMAEVATNILHNVGNVLTSVTVSATTMAERLEWSELQHFRALTALLERHRGDLGYFLTEDIQGRHLPEYLFQSVTTLVEERDVLLDELVRITKGIDHIREIVALQQRHTRPGVEAWDADPVELLEAAIGLNRPVLERHHIDVIRAFVDHDRVRAPRHLVLQILINLVANAVASLREVGERPRRMTIGTNLESEGTLGLLVADEGVGISEEDIAQVFNRGYTTREDGHGLGLSLSARQAEELGGRLSVTSPGIGHGARFTLHLPVVART